MFLLLAQMIVPAVMAAETQTVEVVATTPVAMIEVSQGQTVNFEIKLSATGSLDEVATSSNPSTAKVYTSYSVDGSTGSASTYSTTYNFWSAPDSPGGSTHITWTGAPAAYSISATASASADATPGDYTIQIGTVTTNPGGITSPGQRLNDNTADTLTIHVRASTTTPLSITAPDDVTREGNTPGGYSGDIGTATAAGGTTPHTITNNAPDPIPRGSNTVTWTVTDGNGGTATATQSVTVGDSIPPTLTAPADRNIEGNTVGGANVLASDLGTATATDFVDPSPVVTNDFVAGFYALGSTTTVTWTATDASGNSASASQTFTIVDTTPPILTAPADKNIEGNTLGGADVLASDLGTATAIDIVDPSPVVTNDFVAGFYALGSTTTVTWTATDASGNSASASQAFTIVDTTPPTITVPATLTVIVNAPKSVLTGSASDIVDASPTLSNDAPSVFPPGTTTVTWTSSDASGNVAHATTIVTAHYHVVGGGFLQPINLDGRSAFKQGSTIPAKFQLTDYNGAYVTNAVANLKYAQITGGTIGSDAEGVSTSAATTGSLFRYDMTGNQYIFNLATKGLAKGSYQIKAVLNDGQSIIDTISLK